MKCLALSVLFVAFLSVGTQAQSSLVLKNKSVKNEILVEILNNSQMRELKPPAPTASNVIIRLFSIGVLGACNPNVETEVTCSNKYYLAVAEIGLGVPQSVYDLGEVGEITKVQWLENSDSDVARLRLEISNYPESRFKYNPKLIRKTVVFELYVNANSLEIKKIK